MSDLQTCLASFAVAAGGTDQGGIENSERHIELYLATYRDDPRVALLTLKTAFQDMRLDGHVATHIYSSLARRLSVLDGEIPCAR
jgi:hypothetical protein